MKLAIVTGGNAGLGLACSEEILHDEDWRVLIACRNPERARDAVARLEQIGRGRVEARSLDLASLASVRALASTLAGPIDALILNAGLQIVTGTTITEDGYETTFAVNHLAHYLLANLLLPKMASDGRIVFVSSNTHDPAQWTGMPKPYFTDPFALARGELPSVEGAGAAGRRRYTTSKLCNVYCAYELDRRLPQLAPGKRIAVNAFDPGFMPATGLARDYGAAARFVTRFLLPLVTFVTPNANRVQTSARRLAQLATDPKYRAVSGRYFSRGQATASSKESYDEGKARALWDASAELTTLPLTGRGGPR